MAPRPYWSGHVRLSLVSFPVRLFPAIDSKSQVSLHQIHKPTNERIRYQKVVPDHGPVDNDEIVKGYEYEKGEYVLLEDDELDHLKLESTKTIDLVQFVDYFEIDALYYDRPYFMVPDGKIGEEAFRVIRDALRGERKVALGQVVLSNKERIAAIKPCGDGMIVETLRYGEEIKKTRSYFEDISEKAPPKEQVELARQLIASKASPFDADRFQDHYQAALRELIEGKLKGELDKMSRRDGDDGEVGNIIDLTQALKRSMGDDKEEAPKKKSTRSSGTKRAAPKKKAPAKKDEPESKSKTGSSKRKSGRKAA